MKYLAETPEDMRNYEDAINRVLIKGNIYNTLRVRGFKSSDIEDLFDKIYYDSKD